MISCVATDDRRATAGIRHPVLHDRECRLVLRAECSGSDGALIDEPKGLLVLGEGRVFGTDPKSTVAAEALRRYADHGPKGLTSMRGEFAAIIYDFRRHRLSAVTDPLSKFPLYYEASAGCFTVGTSLRGFRKRKNVSSLDPVYIAVNLVTERLASGRTPFRDQGRTCRRIYVPSTCVRSSARPWQTAFPTSPAPSPYPSVED
jgi:asparagine synthetase B (glutamine-hydrolysing)